jgi:NADH-quinone oxidoreductase subunit A
LANRRALSSLSEKEDVLSANSRPASSVGAVQNRVQARSFAKAAKFEPVPDFAHRLVSRIRLGSWPSGLTHCSNPHYIHIEGPFSTGLMPTSFPQVYWPVFLQVALAAVIAAGMIGASALLGQRVRNRVKDTPYECGIVPVGSARERFSVKFYLVAMIFILFDIETVFLYPWAVVYRELKMFAFVEMFLFVVLILSGFFYVLKKGALDWSSTEMRGSDQ